MDCDCGVPAVQKLSGESAKNPNELFWTCGTRSCKFFKFVNPALNFNKGGGGGGRGRGRGQAKSAQVPVTYAKKIDRVTLNDLDDGLQLAIEANTLSNQCLTNSVNENTRVMQQLIAQNKKKSAYDELLEKKPSVTLSPSDRPRKRARPEPPMPELESQGEEEDAAEIEKLNS